MIRNLLVAPLVWLFIAVYTGLYIIFSVLTLRKLNDVVLAPAAHLWSKVILGLIGVKLECKNLEYLQDPKSRVIIFNHQSALDLLILTYILPPRSTAITKKEFIYIPFINLALWSAHYIFLDRSNRSRAVQALSKLPEWIREEKRSLLISPEGTRTPTGKLLPFKKGAFRIALDGHFDIYPLVIDGAFDLWPKQRFLPKPGVVRVECLPPVSTADWSVEELDGRIREIRERYLGVLGEK